MKRLSCLGILLFSLILLASCSSTEIVSSWKSADVQAKDFTKVMVLGLMGAKDRDIKENTERVMAESLRSRGIDAVAASDEYGPKAFENLSEEEALRKLHDKDVDGVMTIVLLDKDKERRYAPGYVYYTPYGIYYNRFWGYYSTLYQRVYTPGYYTSSVNYTMEANLYDISADKLLYSAQTKSFDPGSAGQLAGDFCKAITDDMVMKGIVTKKTP